MQNQNPHHKNHNNISMSDTESQVSQLDSFHSPLRSDSPFRSDDPVYGPHHPTSPSKPIVTVDKYFSPAPAEERRSPVVYFSRTIREEPAPTGAVVKKVGPVGVGSGGDVEGGDVGGGQRRSTAPTSIGRSEKEAVIMNKAGLGFRICEVIFCLISFSVMAADKTQGWTGDSFYRYIEYRYCVAVNVIGFAYSGFQAFDSAYSLATRKHFISPHIRYHFDFLMDQILAYLLMSASSSAATRVDDWISNWGKDEFTEMASASIAMSFLAFLAFAFSSLISGYSLCNRSSS